MKLESAISKLNAVPAKGFDPNLYGFEVVGFSTDSRSVQTGEVFFAFSQPEFENNGFNGEFLDATAFVRTAFENGALAAVVRQDRIPEHDLEEFSSRLLISDDVVRSFQTLASEVCKEWGKPVIAITGSAGKTTAKDLTAHVLSSSGRTVLKNELNLNNGIGVPLTILKLTNNETFDVAVVEMGMSSPKHEIRRLCEIAPPQIGIVLNVLPVHIEHLGTIERIAQAKGEMVEGIREGGVAVLNADDERVLAMKEMHDGPVLLFGIENKADISAENIVMKRFGETHFVLKTPDGDENVVFQLSGKHNILNALAASAVGYNFGMTAAEISRSLETVKPPRQRGEIVRFGGITLINDAYNSNPAALLKMVGLMNEGTPKTGRRILICGEMLELGEDEKAIHFETGRHIAEIGVDILVGVRGLAGDLVSGASKSGVKETEFFETPEEAGEFVADILKDGDVVLVKGSRGVRTEKAVEAISSRLG